MPNFFYATLENGRCVGESMLSGPVEAPNMISIPHADGSFIGRLWDGSVWHDWTPPPDLRPRLIVTEITADPAWGMAVSQDLSDVTIPAGATMTITAELRHPIANDVLPLDGTFRMPIRARDGREIVVLVGMQQGIATADIPLKQSGAWSVDEETINSGLPLEQHMQFAGITAFVVEI
jgi:hypothetical protein